MPKVTSGFITLTDISDVFALRFEEEIYQLPCTWQGSYAITTHNFIAHIDTSSTEKLNLKEWKFYLKSNTEGLSVKFSNNNTVLDGSTLIDNNITIIATLADTTTANTFNATLTATMRSSFVSINKVFTITKNIPAAPALQFTSNLNSFSFVTDSSGKIEKDQDFIATFSVTQGDITRVITSKTISPSSLEWFNFATPSLSELKITAINGKTVTSDSGTIAVTINSTDYFNNAKSYTINIPWSMIKKGQDGKAIKEVEEFYKLTNDATTPPSTSDLTTWSSAPSTPTSSNQYLWNCERIKYSDDTYGNVTSPVIISRYTTDGKSITEIKNAYKLGNSTTPPEKPGKDETFWSQSSPGTTTSWGTVCPTTTNDYRYIYNCERISYSDNSKVVTDVAIIGVQGEPGQDGEDGKDGEDAYSLIIESSNGNIFKNSSGTTTLTANIYKGSTLINDGTHTEYSFTYKWYKGATEIPGATTKTLSGISAADIDQRATYKVEVDWTITPST